jgi:TonB family protein
MQLTPMKHLARRPTSGIPLFCLAALLISPVTQAQTASPAGTPETSVSDRVKKDAASPLYWIRLNAQKGDTAAAPKAAPRIAEIRPVPAAALAKPMTSPPPPAGSGTTAVASNASSGSSSASSAMASANDATAVLAAPGPLAAPNPAGAHLAGALGAGMVAPSAPSAAEAARAAAAEAEEPLALVKADEPEFPVIVMRRLRKGSVQVRFDVQPDGAVANATVVQTTARSLNDAALEAVRTWQFKPVSSSRSAIVDLGFDLDG